MYSQRGHELLDYLRRVWLPQDVADEFLQALQQLDQKGFKKYFQVFVLILYSSDHNYLTMKLDINSFLFE